MKAVILAAGKGTRLRPLSSHVSKAMMPISNVPMIERLIRQIHDETGVSEFIIVAGSPDQDVVDYFRNSSGSPRLKNLSFDFAFQREQNGMGHAVKCLFESIELDEPFLLAACDCLYPQGEIAMLAGSFNSGDCDASIALVELPPHIMSIASTVRIEDNKVTKIIEKPSPEEILSPYASVPMYILGPGISAYLPRVEPSRRGEIELQSAFQMWIDEGGVFRCVQFSGRETVTAIHDLVRLNGEYAMREAMPGQTGWDDVLVVEPVLSGEDVQVGAGTALGPNVTIGDNANIGADCRLKDVVVFAGSTIPAGRTLENGCWHRDTFYPA